MANVIRYKGPVEYGTGLPVVTAASRGLKTLQTTGNVTAGSPIITNIPDTSAWTVGDYIIYECDQLPETLGVGGTWPSLAYASEAARAADTSKPVNTLSYVTGSDPMAPLGSLRWYNAATQTWNYLYGTTPWGSFYWDRAVPYALKGRIVSKTSTTITIDANAQASASGSRLFFDNFYAMQSVVTGDTKVQNSVFQFGSGTYAFSAGVLAQNMVGVVFQGAGTDLTNILSPRGTPSITLYLLNCTNCHVRKLHMVGNSRDSGYGTGLPVTASQTNWDRGIVTDCIMFHGCTGGTNETNPTGTVSDVKITDCWNNAVGTRASNYVYAYRCKAYGPGHRCYIQWQFLWADSNYGGTRKCEVHGTKMLQGFETFRSNYVSHNNLIGTNTALSMNSSGNWLYDSPVVTIQNSAGIEAWAISASIAAISKNITPPAATYSDGGELRNPTFIVQGALGNSAGGATNWCINHVSIAPDATNCRFTGTHGQSGTPKGLFQSPDPVEAGGSGGRYGVIGDNPAGTLVKGIRFIGGFNTPGSTHVGIGASVGTVEDCVFNDPTRLSALNKINNISTADFLAEGAAYDAYLAAAQS